MIAIPLTKGYEAFISPEDMENVSKHKWHAMTKPGRTTYAACHDPKDHRKLIWLHRFIINAPKGIPVDHRDGDGLNCCRDNLRLCTPEGNAQNRPMPRTNTSGYKGVSWHKHVKKWAARIWQNGKLLHLGFYETTEAASKAYQKAAIEIHGEFANF